MWRTMTMDELWLLVANTNSKVFAKPTFPCRRWGQSYTKTSTTDKKVIDKSVEKLKEDNKKVRKRICQESSIKFKNLGKFYKIEIYETINTNSSN